jgi:hypothetical protein
MVAIQPPVATKLKVCPTWDLPAVSMQANKVLQTHNSKKASAATFNVQGCSCYSLGVAQAHPELPSQLNTLLQPRALQ